MNKTAANIKKDLALFLSCMLLVFLCTMMWVQMRQDNLAGRIAPGILRLHVIGNSNSNDDQLLKLEVKSYFLDLISQFTADSKADLENQILENQKTLENQMTHFITSRGYDYEASISAGSFWFPAKSYGDMTLPCGEYEAIRVQIGQARGRNWWCVLYPRLCFLDITHAAVPEESRKELQKLMSPQDYAAILDENRRAPSGSVKAQTEARPQIRSFLYDFLTGAAAEDPG